MNKNPKGHSLPRPPKLRFSSAVCFYKELQPVRQFTHNPIAMMRPTNQTMSSVELQRPAVYCVGLHLGAATITLSLVLTVISLWSLYTSSTSLAHRFAIFLHSLDVEIDDNLVGQLTLAPQLHPVLDLHFALCTLLKVRVFQCALCWVCTVCTVCTVQVTGSGEGAGDNQTITVTQLQLLRPTCIMPKFPHQRWAIGQKTFFMCVFGGRGGGRNQPHLLDFSSSPKKVTENIFSS